MMSDVSWTRMRSHGVFVVGDVAIEQRKRAEVDRKCFFRPNCYRTLWKKKCSSPRIGSGVHESRRDREDRHG